MISIVLVEPENPGNIGAVARVMKNFDFLNLVLVNPKCSIRSSECIARAKHAKDVLKKAKIVKTIPRFDYLIATTSQLGTDYNIPRSPIDPSQLADKLSKIKNRKIGILFGREGEGLFNEEILASDFVVTIPTSEKYPTMNLSHSVAVFLYELSKDWKGKIGEQINPVGDAEKRQMVKMFNKAINKMGFLTKENKETQRRVWKRVIGKSFMTKRESFAVMGFLRKIIKK
ncbi:RNA methyltransferase [Candidatus Woesearchaeota archaeon]|nr:RNA methyltransferase [Candidatus Woesearchaeota archaeon]